MRLVLERVAPAGTRSPKRVLLNGERVGDGWRELPWREAPPKEMVWVPGGSGRISTQ
jgi:hypothetical protein